MTLHASNRRLVATLLLLLACAGAQAGESSYSVISTIPAPDGDYDYMSVDSAKQRLYVARAYGVMVVDLASGKVTPKLLDTGTWLSAVLLIPGTNSILSTVYDENRALLFDRSSGAIEARIPAGKGPDAALFEPNSKLAYVMNGESGDVSVIDTAAKKVVATVPVGGKPEAAASDGHGKVFVNIEDKADIAVLDVTSHKVIGRYALPGCEEPTGLAYDAKSGLLISACHNGKAKLIDAKSGADRGTVEIGRDADGAIFDETRRFVYIPCNDGTLTIFHLDQAGRAASIASVKTASGARTAALDEKTGRIYLPAVDTKQDAAGKEHEVPGTFRILVVAPK